MKSLQQRLELTAPSYNATRETSKTTKKPLSYTKMRIIPRNVIKEIQTTKKPLSYTKMRKIPRNVIKEIQTTKKPLSYTKMRKILRNVIKEIIQETVKPLFYMSEK